MRIGILLALVLLLGLPLGACNQAGDASVKIAVVDRERIFRDSEPAKLAKKALEEQGTAMQGKLNEIQDRLSKDPNDEGAQKELQTVYMSSQQRMQAMQGNVVGLLEDAIVRAINGIRDKKGYIVVLYADMAASYAPSVDVTGDVLAELNKQKLDFQAVMDAPSGETEAPAESVKSEGAAPAEKPSGDAAKSDDAGKKPAGDDAKSDDAGKKPGKASGDDAKSESKEPEKK
ncbi:MAG: OmpH family outer membrane protein [Desulfovibrio sp.]|jgi:outer membrane protein|nr:OmpH family outer membrane protein [Desulfovibrio sp.]